MNSERTFPSRPLDIDLQEFYASLEAATPVRLIQTPKEHLRTCHVDDLVDSVVENAALVEFDFIPVLEEDATVGIFDKRAASERSSRRVSESFRRLHPDYLISTEASVFQFIEIADQERCCFLVGPTAITGLVTVSDLQKLPVQAALFGLVVHFEHVVADKLRQAFPNDQAKGVLAHLDREARRNAERQKERMDKENLSLDWITPLSFSNKLDALRSVDPDAIENWEALQEVKELRNNLAHGNEFAATYELIGKLINSKRSLQQLTRELSEARESPRQKGKAAFSRHPDAGTRSAR